LWWPKYIAVVWWWLNLVSVVRWQPNLITMQLWQLKTFQLPSHVATKRFSIAMCDGDRIVFSHHSYMVIKRFPTVMPMWWSKIICSLQCLSIPPTSHFFPSLFPPWWRPKPFWSPSYLIPSLKTKVINGNPLWN
jgi:hypothetical protein